MLQGLQISYRGKNYRVQNANGWKHIIVTENKIKKRIGLNAIEKENESDWCFDYIFGGLFQTYPCPAIEYFIYRHRRGHRISAKDYAVKFEVKRRRKSA